MDEVILPVEEIRRILEEEGAEAWSYDPREKTINNSNGERIAKVFPHTDPTLQNSHGEMLAALPRLLRQVLKENDRFARFEETIERLNRELEKAYTKAYEGYIEAEADSDFEKEQEAKAAAIKTIQGQLVDALAELREEGTTDSSGIVQ